MVAMEPLRAPSASLLPLEDLEMLPSLEHSTPQPQAWLIHCPPCSSPLWFPATPWPVPHLSSSRGCLCFVFPLPTMLFSNGQGRVILSSSPPGTFAMSGDIFGCLNSGVAGKWGSHQHLVGGGQGRYSIHSSTQDAPLTT